MTCHAGIYCCCHYAASAQVVHLIFHQGDERRDDNTHSLSSKSRNLKGYRLAASGRHQSECVVSAADAFDNVALYSPEVGVAPVLAQYSCIFVRTVAHADNVFCMVVGV